MATHSAALCFLPGSLSFWPNPHFSSVLRGTLKPAGTSKEKVLSPMIARLCALYYVNLAGPNLLIICDI